MAQHLPAELINLIMEFCDQYEIIHFTAVCRCWHECIEVRQLKFSSRLMIDRWMECRRWFNTCLSSSHSLVCGYTSNRVGVALQKITKPFENLKIVKLYGQELPSQERLNSEGVAALFNCGAFENVEEWHLESQNIRSTSFLKGHEKKIRVLNLNDNDIEMLELEYFTKLKELHLRCNNLHSPSIIQQISECKSQLTCLDLSMNSFSLQHVELIAANETLNHSLRKLNLSGSEFSGPVLKLLSRFTNLTHLTLKWMYCTNPTDVNLSSDVAKFVACLAKLTSLNFANNKTMLTRILKAISNSSSMKNLTYLNLSSSGVKEEDLIEISRYQFTCQKSKYDKSDLSGCIL
ncbi:hypothetical protein NAEGRDRAFT_72850 [Naegleria gruberi]|uniref:F-box domain-containing protein n=1 Tax=Naegleria gruberi TaxID=5762 RepID=D2VV08_NAEGR|nr:uncharacterized protein NAEGRDRAFT_72850 [Naegleria gruberi]EFC39413.1 hypothetical protein NAEGRDRAFT_72850 [Naegleria gruberi]|eukprot:XP_002672157.1 hypothetical protein NAEGRDRAFT_72850 [Naegleria gruberi strain NEG-M]